MCPRLGVVVSETRARRRMGSEKTRSRGCAVLPRPQTRDHDPRSGARCVPNRGSWTPGARPGCMRVRESPDHGVASFPRPPDTRPQPPQSGARDVQNRGLWPPGRFLAQFSDSAALYHRILMYGNKYERFVRHDIAKKEASHRVFADDPLVATRWAQRDSISLRETTAPR